MTHKVHPESFRREDAEDWDSQWMDPNSLADNLEKDYKIRQFFEKALEDAGIEKILIKRFPGEMKIDIKTSRPGLVIGRRGQGIEELKEDLEAELLSDYDGKINVEVKGIKDPWVKAKLASDWVAKQIEQRTPYRRAIKQALGKVMNHGEVEGARVEVAGRLNGLEFARDEWIEEGSLPRQTHRADIDYGESEAYCSYGTIGVKVWIYTGKTFEEDED